MAEQAGPTPSYYPVSLDVSGRPCLVVGGGAVAARKAGGLLECGARVTVIAPSTGTAMESLSPALAVLERRPYKDGDVRGFRLVITATGVPAVDEAVHADAESFGIWVNSADDRAHSSFILPAVHRDGAVTVAVSTGGLSPALSAWLRSRLASRELGGVGALAELLGEARARLIQSGVPRDAVDWAALLDGPLPALVAAGDLDNAQAIVAAATAN